MFGHLAAFEFNVPRRISPIPWNALDPYIRNELTRTDEATEESSQVYLCKVDTVQASQSLGKTHHWSRVKRIFIDVSMRSKSISVFGISPGNRRVEGRGQQVLSFESFLAPISNKKLFKIRGGKIDVDSYIKDIARKDRYAVLSRRAKRAAQWIFTEGWERSEFELYFYLLVPNILEDEKRYVKLSIVPTHKKCKVITHARFENQVFLEPR